MIYYMNFLFPFVFAPLITNCTKKSSLSVNATLYKYCAHSISQLNEKL